MDDSTFFSQFGAADLELRGDKLREECFERFSEPDKAKALTLEGFHSMWRELFTDADGKCYSVSDEDVKVIFDKFDLDRDNKINESEFSRLWTSLVTPVLLPKPALIVIDVQNDFIDGSLAIRNCPAGQEGAEVVQAINSLLDMFETVVYTFDWHPENHISFVENASKYKFHESSTVKCEDAKVFDTVLFQGPPEFEQKLWPKHCVQNSWGSELHPDLRVVDNAILIYKGTSSDIDSYSAFWDNQKKSQTNLHQELKARNITDVFVSGLAFDYCVGSTALHALELGYRTILVEDACRGVSLDDMKKMKEQLTSKHGIIVNSEEVEALVKGIDRRPELGIFTALNCLD